jgi:hypothetical protein
MEERKEKFIWGFNKKSKFFKDPHSGFTRAQDDHKTTLVIKLTHGSQTQVSSRASKTHIFVIECFIKLVFNRSIWQFLKHNRGPHRSCWWTACGPRNACLRPLHWHISLRTFGKSTPLVHCFFKVSPLNHKRTTSYFVLNTYILFLLVHWFILDVTI